MKKNIEDKEDWANKEKMGETRESGGVTQKRRKS